MSQTKTRRVAKRQLGQFMTPIELATKLVGDLRLSPSTRMLEPSFGDGSFIIPLIDRFLPLYSGDLHTRLDLILSRNVFGVEIDPVLYRSCLGRIESHWGYLPKIHNLICSDFFQHDFGQYFHYIVGNPPFGGTINPKLQGALDRQYGIRNGEKIKKETYAFFVVKCLDTLSPDGTLLFICSDTLMTIPTMKGLRRLIMEHCGVEIDALPSFSEETSYPMVLLRLSRTGRTDHVVINGRRILRDAMQLTGNHSWSITEDSTKFFTGSKLGDFVVCSSGMTIGKNDLFVRELVDGAIIEPYVFEFFNDPIAAEKEVALAKYGSLSPSLLARVREQERAGAAKRNVRAIQKATPERINIPHPDYRLYNKANSAIVYSPPSHAIFWKDDGDAVLTFKKNGPWYLHGVGGQPFFGKSGLTWQLVAARLNVRYLPEGYILDSGAPCAFPRPEVPDSELYFILGWTCTDLCTRLLKTVINHTMNIQSKDFERLPYPFWVRMEDKEQAISIVRDLLKQALHGAVITRAHRAISALDSLYAWQQTKGEAPEIPVRELKQMQLALF